MLRLLAPLGLFLLLLPFATADTKDCSTPTCNLCSLVATAGRTVHLSKDVTLTSRYCGGTIRHAVSVVGNILTDASACFTYLGESWCAASTIDGAGQYHIFFLSGTGADFYASNLRLVNGLGDAGGAVRATGGAKATLVKLVLTGNRASEGGALASQQAGSLITGVGLYFADNYATAYGGGALTTKAAVAGAAYNGEATMLSCYFSETVPNGAPGSYPQVISGDIRSCADDGWCSSCGPGPASNPIWGRGWSCNSCNPIAAGNYWDHSANACAQCSPNHYCVSGVQVACAADGDGFGGEAGNDEAADCNAPTAPPTEAPPTAPPTHPPGVVCEQIGAVVVCAGSAYPTAAPTADPTAAPTTQAPTAAPTAEPTAAPTTQAPTAAPTADPTAVPTAAPTTQTPTMPGATWTPTAAPTAEPTAEPTTAPTAEPTAAPTAEPTDAPTTDAPTLPGATLDPTARPTAAPTRTVGMLGGDSTTTEDESNPDSGSVGLIVVGFFILAGALAGVSFSASGKSFGDWAQDVLPSGFGSSSGSSKRQLPVGGGADLGAGDKAAVELPPHQTTESTALAEV